MILTWQPMYSVNVGEIDEQHKKLFEIINKLIEVKNNQIDDEFFKELEDYAKYHFSTEEKYFEEFIYPEKESHIKMYHFYNEKIEEFKKNKNNNVLAELKDFLRVWWLEHIQNADQRYSDFFNQSGLY